MFDSAFLHSSRHSRYSSQWATLLALKVAPSRGGSEPPSNTWFLEPTRVFNPNSILIGSAVFAGLSTVTDRPTPCYSVYKL